VRPRRLRSVIVGEAGIWLALALAFVAALTSFIAAAGPREVTGSENGAIQTAINQIAPVDRTIDVSANWVPVAGARSTIMDPGVQTEFADSFAPDIAPPISVAAGSIRAFVSGPLLQLPFIGTPQQMILLKPPTLQLSTDSALQADARLVAGTWPTGTSRLPGDSAAARSTLVIEVALTKALASKFGLHPGLLLPLSPVSGRPVVLRVTGIIQPKPDALLNAIPDAQPIVSLDGSSSGSWYLIGAFVAQDEMQAMQSLWQGLSSFGDWYYPVQLTHLTGAGLGRLAAAITTVTTATYAADTGRDTGFGFVPPLPKATSQLPGELVSIQQQVSAATAIDELVVAGLFAACLLLMLLCAGLAADRYAPELALMRARGSSTRQVAIRTLARAIWVSGPGVAAGVVLAMRFGAPTANEWVLPAVNGAFAIGAVPIRCTWRLRRNGAWQAAQRPEAAARRRSPRRVIAEVTVLTLAAAAVVALRLRGVAGGSDQLGIAAPILVAIVASIFIGRLYPIPVRGLLPLAARRRGSVGFLGLTQAGRSGLGAILPALALVLTLTLAAFGVMLTQSVASGQVASTWASTGADALFTAPGNGVIAATAQHAVDAVAGVKHTALVAIEANTYQSNNIILTSSGSPVSLGVGIVDPRSYAALSKDTPWPLFPASAIGQRGGPVPILVSAAAAASQPGLDVGARQTLSAYGTKIPVVVEGIIGDTPAFPTGGPFVIFPQWAVAQMPIVPGPNELLVTGPKLSVPQLRKVGEVHLHGDGLQLRSDLLSAQLKSAAEFAVRLFALGSWAAAALSAVALFFGLGATAQSRRTLRSRMSAMGMSSRQARALALFDPVALLIVAVVGMLMSAGLLALISRQIIPLSSLTSSSSPVPVSLSLPALALPAAGAVALALIVITAEHVLAARSESSQALRYEEAG
jgi:putative ABC transport system permease protein